MQSFLERIVDWIHGYISAREDQPNSKRRGHGDYMYVDIRAHGPFYAACQSALYIFAFRSVQTRRDVSYFALFIFPSFPLLKFCTRHEEFVSNESLLRFLRGLNLSTVVTSRLNPLRVCLPSVVANFAAVARKYQLVYCDAIIERNARINLPVVGWVKLVVAVLLQTGLKGLTVLGFFFFLISVV